MNTMENIITENFPKSVLDQANAAARIKPASLLAHRLDLRGKTIFAFTESTNSTADCAYSLYETENGWQLGIHVADVCEYVCEGSPLDIEARKRRATVINGTSRSNMLPDQIVNEICNLATKGDKLAISVILNLDQDGSIIDIQFEESVIRISDTCVYSEIDKLLSSWDASSISLLRGKYTPYRNILGDMYMLAARFCVDRRKRGGLDCAYFKNEYRRNDQGKIISITQTEDYDSRAMLRELGYFIADAVGKYMYESKLPCVFNSRDAVDSATLGYLSKLVNVDISQNNNPEIAAAIADNAKGTPYYSFVCQALAMNLPIPTYTTAPAMNCLCGSDTIVSFFNPVNRYTDLLIQRVMKTAIKAKDPKNLNLNRQKKIVEAVAAEANTAEQFIYKTRNDYTAECALEYLQHSFQDNFAGFPVHTNEDGSILVLMGCGVKGIIPAEIAKGFEYFPARPQLFKVIALGDENKLTALQPID